MSTPIPLANHLPVSVIVVCADSGPSLRDCVQRVLDSTVPLELILIDNGSTDAVPSSIEQAHAHDPRLKVIYNHANLGFGPAVNRAAAVATGEHLLVLNPDCLLEPDTLTRMLDTLDEHPEAGIVGAVVCAADGTPDPASYRRDPLLRHALATLLGARGGMNIDGAIPAQVVDAEAVSGALMLLPRKVFERLGGFDEAYFLHCEDLDLCRRARDAGHAVLLAGDVRVLHGKGGSSRHRPVFVSRHKHRGMWRWFRKFDPAARNPLVAGAVWVGIWAHFVMQVPGQWWRLARALRRAA
ncbi:glycosyltransferase family 2 protein [Frateuria hangzhouensis]|uniref:glycosyltransferase family 2 protein n=1 Tax=Frateuria hangzhouensis TaxID=2995589 RepID=UPI002260F2DB|nr:glycosyltransferase family 2 protein [Frateuria sp. STR12]MCX7512981.1 glycosyltransferase family 2 protein [Frateuria sp. STR12]